MGHRSRFYAVPPPATLAPSDKAALPRPHKRILGVYNIEAAARQGSQGEEHLRMCKGGRLGGQPAPRCDPPTPLLHWRHAWAAKLCTACVYNMFCLCGLRGHPLCALKPSRVLCCTSRCCPAPLGPRQASGYAQLRRAAGAAGTCTLCTSGSAHAKKKFSCPHLSFGRLVSNNGASNCAGHR